MLDKQELMVLLRQEQPDVIKAASHIKYWFGLDQPPSTVEAFVAIARAMASMCPEDQFEWLSDRVLNGVTKFPKPLELRRICCRGKDEPHDYPGIIPKDGLEPARLDMEEIAGGGG